MVRPRTLPPGAAAKVDGEPEKKPRKKVKPSSEWNRKNGNRVFWCDDIPGAVGGAIRAGLREEDLARVLRIHPMTLTKWKKEHPELDLAIKTALDDVRSGHIEGTLYQRAMGYPYEERKKVYERKLVPVLDSETGEPRINPLTQQPVMEWQMVLSKDEVMEKRMAPDVTAIIYWLWNRYKDRWRKEPSAVEIGDTDSFKELVNILRKGPVKRKEEPATV